MEKLKCEKNFTFVKFHFYVNTDDFGGKNEKKW